MNVDVFISIIAPLMSLKLIRVARLVSKYWQNVFDSILPYKPLYGSMIRQRTHSVACHMMGYGPMNMQYICNYGIRGTDTQPGTEQIPSGKYGLTIDTSRFDVAAGNGHIEVVQ
jgi:hypothetical protein